MKYFLMLLISVSVNSFAKEHIVKMHTQKNSEMMIFDPEFIRVDIGDTIVFTPTSEDHNSKSILVPKEAKNWNSKDGETIKVTLDKEGLYAFECTNHAIMGMIGAVQVGKAVNKESFTSTLKTLESKLVMNKNRVQRILSNIR